MTSVKIKAIIAALIFSTVYSAAAAEPLTLQECVSEGLKNNKDICYLNEESSLQILALDEQYRKFYPQASLSYAETDQVNMNSPDYRLRNLSVSVSQLIYDGNKLGTEIEIEKNNISISLLENSQKRIDFIFQIVSGYLSILKQQEKINIKKQLIETQEKELNISKKKNEVGEATKLDVLEWQIECNQSTVDELQLENDLVFGKMSLMKLLGIDIGNSFEAREKLEIDVAASFIDYIEDSVISEALENSIDLKKIQISIIKAKETSVLHNLLLPDITLNFSYTTDPNYLFHPDASSWTAGINFSIPFFFDVLNFGNSYGGNMNGSQKSQDPQISSTVYQDPSFTRKLKEDAFSFDQLSSQYHDKIEEIKLDTKKKLSDFKFQKEKIEMLDEKIKLAEGKNTILYHQVQVGEALLSDYINSLNTLSEMKMERVESLYDYTTLMIEIYKIRGKLSEDIVKSLYKDFLKEV